MTKTRRSILNFLDKQGTFYGRYQAGEKRYYKEAVKMKAEGWKVTFKEENVQHRYTDSDGNTDGTTYHKTLSYIIYKK